MSARSLFAPDGDTYSPVPSRIKKFPTGKRLCAILVWSAITERLRHESNEIKISDRWLSRSSWLEGFSLEFLRKGLESLEKYGLIKRERGRGRRTIIVTGRLRGGPFRTPRIDYKSYMSSPEWEKHRKAAVERSGNRCQVCNESGLLNVHHRSYERLGNELPGDLIVLCRECHRIFHELGRLADPPSQEASQ